MEPRTTGTRFATPLTRLTRLLAVPAIVMLVAAATSCGDDNKESASSTTSKATTTSSASTTTAASSDDAWKQTAQQFRGQSATTHDLTCTPGGKAASVWGTGTYTDDSSLCTAAVQSGLVTFDKGGSVTFEIAPGKDAYEGGTANGVTSEDYGRFDGSFTFPKAPPGSVEFAVGADSWNRNVADRSDQVGSQVTIACSSNGTPGSVWGSGPYTADSSVCTAAVHAGLLTVAKGGKVTVEVAAGQDSYKGTTANGITSNDYGSFGTSFTFPSPQPKS